ncbi:DUF3267 domain-containing protein [Haloferax sp. ATB1]|uniref:DUF3267 domain-containing protein n=1 Tax=Haloferax sp. ATB1 TaxID=1508454 RepID=UPI0005B1FC69|nr:DUF3267 domain-containing protein [Haloferax sp. ATB1]
MQKDWPPEGYSEPREYDKNERHIIGIAFVIAGVFAVPALLPVHEGVTAYWVMWSDLAAVLNISYLTTAVGGTVTSMVGIYVLFRKVMVPIHEGIHYGVGLLLELNPRFGYEEMMFHKNPNVVALSTNIPAWKNMAMLIAPFAIIGLLSWGLVQVSGGLVAGIAAIVLWINSAASAQDLYHYVRLLRMNPETKFANFEEGNQIRTEYAVPEQ